MTSKERTRGQAHGVTTRSAWLTLAAGFALLPLTVPRAPAAEAPTYTVLYNFQGQPDGSGPYAGVIADTAGNLYGATSVGGAYGYGEVFKLDTTGYETVLHSFSGGSDGAYPSASLSRDAAGSLYGTAEAGGTFNSTCPFGCGVVFQVNPQGKERVLYSFTGGSDGAAPNSGLVRDTAGNLYGTTSAGGNTSLCSGFGCGVVFRLDPAGNETALYSFTGGSDRWEPDSVLTRDAAGNIYGTTDIGGNLSCGPNSLGCGVVFKLDSTGNETTLYTFGGPDGENPIGGVVRDTAGNLYGLTASGGANKLGAIFKLGSSGKETLLHSFTGSDGSVPIAGPLLYKGSLFGTTYVGGPSQDGVVFKIVP